MEKAREFQKNISFCFIDYVKAFDCVDTKIVMGSLGTSQVALVVKNPPANARDV